MPAAFSSIIVCRSRSLLGVLTSCHLSEIGHDTSSRAAPLVWVGKVALNLWAAAVIRLHVAAYFSLRVFLSPVAHDQYGVCVARLTLLLNDRHLLAQASGEGMMVPAEVPFWNVFVGLR